MPTWQYLFAATHWLLKAAAVFSAFIVVVLGLALGGLSVAALNLGGNHLGIPASIAGVARIDALRIASLAVTAGLLSFVLIPLAIRATTAIVQSAMSGNPFVNENARRLTHIGWFLLALFVVEWVSNVTFHGLMNSLIHEHRLALSGMGRITFGPSVSPIGLLTILLIFVLAQIFRRGSEMRAELEGTI